MRSHVLAGVALVVAALLAAAVAAEREAPADARAPGGATTVPANGRNAFSFPLANLAEAERTRFVIGNSFFRRNWVEAPASTQARDGLGPHFIARSCGGCHVQDGRGAPPTMPGEQPVALLMRLSIAGTDAHGGPRPEPAYGDQLNNAAVQGVRPEGAVVIRERTVPGLFADGTPYTLRQPIYGVRKLGYGPLQKGTMTSPRIAPQLIGVGLLEAIPEAEILRNAREQAAIAARTGGLVRGQPNRVWDAKAQAMMLGRFGWKANVATLAHQTGGAFVGDIGITSSLFPSEACTTTQADCLAAPHGGRGSEAGEIKDAGKDADRSPGTRPEIDDATFADVVFYQATLAPPARRDADNPTVRRGEALFHQAQCSTCHRPSYVTGDSPFRALASPALKGQTIWPYTDLLLHDMGEGLADGRPDYVANGRQWKTPPLWGIGLIREVNGHQRLLHDGRARGVLEALLWHGGEADLSRQAVLKMSRDERAALVRFVESL